jgi:hypothetical protein
MPWTIANLLLHDKPVQLGNMRSLGQTGRFVCCSNPGCNHNAELNAEVLPDETTFNDLRAWNARSAVTAELMSARLGSSPRWNSLGLILIFFNLGGIVVKVMKRLLLAVVNHDGRSDSFVVLILEECRIGTPRARRGVRSSQAHHVTARSVIRSPHIRNFNRSGKSCFKSSLFSSVRFGFRARWGWRDIVRWRKLD